MVLDPQSVEAVSNVSQKEFGVAGRAHSAPAEAPEILRGFRKPVK